MLGWLVANGLYRDLLSAAILVPIMHLMAARPLKRVADAVERARQDMRDVAAHAATPWQDAGYRAPAPRVGARKGG